MSEPRKVFKFPIPGAEVGAFSLALPMGWEACTVERQNGELMLWALVPDAPHTEQRFVWHGTGHPVGDGERFIATIHEPPFVWHLFALNTGERFYPQPEKPLPERVGAVAKRVREGADRRGCGPAYVYMTEADAARLLACAEASDAWQRGGFNPYDEVAWRRTVTGESA